GGRAPRDPRAVSELAGRPGQGDPPAPGPGSGAAAGRALVRGALGRAGPRGGAGAGATHRLSAVLARASGPRPRAAPRVPRPGRAPPELVRGGARRLAGRRAPPGGLRRGRAHGAPDPSGPATRRTAPPGGRLPMAPAATLLT